MPTPIYRCPLPSEMDGGKLETALADAGYLPAPDGVTLRLRVVDGQVELRPPRRWTDEEWAGVQRLVAAFVPVPDPPTRMEVLRAKRRRGEPLTVDEQAEVLDCLMGV